MSYEVCAKHRNADATNGCQWCLKEAQLACEHYNWQCTDCGATPPGPLFFSHAAAIELGLQWLATPEHAR
jgi:hypothetical protein